MQSIGERLEEARKRKGVTIREAAEATKIRGDYLNSFENNNFSINVPEIYVRGFLRSYCNFLKVNSEKVITDYNANLIGEAKAAKRDHREFFGRMEIQQTPLVNEEKKPGGATVIDDAKLSADDDEEDKPGFLEKIDKETAIKVGIVAVIAIMLLLLIVWIVRSLTSGGIDPDDVAQQNARGMVPSQSTSQVQQPAPAAAKEMIALIAVGDVRVSVIEESTNRVLLESQPMSAGQRIEIEKTGKVRIEYSAGENLTVEAVDKRDGIRKVFGTGRRGEDFSTIP